MSLSKKIFAVIICSLTFTSQVYAESTRSVQNTSPSPFSVRVSKDDVGEISDSLVITEPFERVSNKLIQNLPDIKLKKILGNEILSFDTIKKQAQKPIIVTNSLDEITDEFKLPNIYNISLTGKSIGFEKVTLANNNASKASPVILSKQTQESDTEFNKTAQEIRNEIQYKDYTRAEILLNASAYKYRTDGWKLAEVASLYQQINNSSKAEVIYDKAVSLNPKRIELLYNYAVCLYKNGKGDKSEKVLNDLLKINPQFTLAYYNLGNILYKKGRYIESLAAYKEAVRLNPLCADAYYNIAMVLEAMKQNTLAQKYYDICLKLKPADIQAEKAAKRVSMLF